MSSKKSHRVGERNVNHQGLTMEIVKYINNKNVEIVFLETGERKTVRYVNFCNRSVKANIIDYPYHIVRQAKKCAKVTKIIFSILGIAALAAILIKIFL